MIKDEGSELKQVFLKFLNKKTPATSDKLIDKIKINNDDGYPYYNLINKSEHNRDIIEIEIALAGFCKDDVMDFRENEQLTIIWKKQIENKHYVHKGISTRSFRKVFFLFDDVKIENSVLRNGILTIRLFLPTEVKESTIEQIEIKEF